MDSGKTDYSRVVECRCRRNDPERIKRLLAWCDLPQETENATFELYEIRSDDHKHACQTAMRIAEDCKGSLLLAGLRGTGKTHLGLAAVRRRVSCAIQEGDVSIGRIGKYVLVPDLLDLLRGSFKNNGEGSYDWLIRQYCDVGLLILDDLGFEVPTPWATEKLDQIIDHRWLRKFPTIVTTNLSPEEFQKRGQVRMADRMLDQQRGWVAINLVGTSYRSGREW